MANDDNRRMHRRRFLMGSAALSGTLLAGCSGTNTDPDNQTEGGSTPESAGGSTPESEETSTPEEESSYSVSMEPVGEVTFDEVPETWVANNGSWADMGVALGLEPPKGVWLTSRYHTQYYDEIPGVSVDKSGMVDLYSDGVSKELFYQLNGDVHVIDPNFLMNRFKGWEQSDVDEISENVGPFFGNSIFSTGYTWHEGYQYYTLYEAFEKLAAVFQRQDRYEAFASLHQTFQSDLDAIVPDTGPSVAVLWAAGDQPESFSPYIIGPGTSFKHLRDLNATDALANTDVKDFHSNRGSIDFETLLEVDPDVLLLRGQEAKTAEEFQNTAAQFIENHSVGSELTAAQNGDIYRAGGLYQGPITNLVLTERLAADLYDVEEELFDRQRVADIVNGDV